MKPTVKVTVTVKRDEFPRLRSRLPAVFDRELGQAAAAIQAGAVARNRAHGLIDTSNMIENWAHDRIREQLWAAYTPVLYAIYWELGHRSHAPRPMLVPAANEALGRLVERLRRLEASL